MDFEDLRNWGHYLSNTPPIVECVLKCLPIKELHKCSRVCKLWSQVVNSIKVKRNQYFWIFWMQRRGKKRKTDPSCDSLKNIINKALTDASSEPTLSLFFTTNRFHENCDRYLKFDQGKNSLSNVMGCCLPPECVLISTSSEGIIGTDSSVQLCMEVENQPGISAFFLPRIPGLDVYTFLIEGSRGRRANVASKDEHLTGIPEDKNLKALLILCNDTGSSIELPIRKLAERYNWQLGLGGGFVDEMIYPEHLRGQAIEYPEHAIAIGFCGDAVTAASIVIDPTVKTRERVAESIKCLKSCCKLGKRSFAFQFACVARGQDYFSEANVEADEFHKAFPSTPLFGFFGNGEIGINYLPHQDGNTSRRQFSTKTPKASTKLMHGFSTIFVVISLND